MLTYISIGPATIPSYPFLSLIAFWAAMWLAAKEAERRGIDGDHLYNIGLYMFVAGILGGRFWYVLTHWDAYADAPLQALALTANAIAAPEAVLFAFIAAIVYVYRNKLDLATIADVGAVGAALGLVIGGIGAFLGSQTLGAPTTLPWAITQFGEARHPAHLYVTLAAAIIFGVLWFWRTKPHPSGFLFWLLIALYAGARLLLDPFFALPATIGGGYRMVQVAALIALIVALAAMARIEKDSGQKI